MKLLSLLRRVLTAVKLLRRHPDVLLRVPAFVQRMLLEGPQVTLRRLRNLSDPSRLAQDYNAWLSDQHDPTPAEQDAMRGWAQTLASPPLISVVMPVFNPDPDWLHQAIQSVRDQWYPHWQLCIADDRSTDPEVREVLERAAAADSRIDVVFREENGHISRCSNSALALARGTWVALLDHDDRLPPDALIWVARAVLEQPGTQMLYSDEDKIDEEGVRFAPYFKPDWNPALIESQNFFSHLGVYRTALLREVGGFRVGLEGSQDYDLMLRCLDAAQGQGIVHLPRVLYHWRVHRQSTASGNQAKPYVTAAAERALQEHLARCGQQGSTDALPQGYRIRRPAPAHCPDLDVLLDARGCSRRSLRRCLKPLLADRRQGQRVFAAVTPKQQAWLERHPSFVRGLPDLIGLVVEESLPVAEALQVLMEAGQAPWMLLWDRHLGALPGSQAWLSELWSQTTVPGVVAAGPQLIDRRGLIHAAGCFLGDQQLAAPAHRGFLREGFGYFGRAALTQDFSVLPPQALMVSRQAVADAGGVLAEPVMAPHWWVDLCLRLRASGGRLVYSPFAGLRVHQNAKPAGDRWPGSAAQRERSEARLRELWQAWMTADPAFNPNLSTHPVSFTPAWPARTARWPVAAVAARAATPAHPPGGSG